VLSGGDDALGRMYAGLEQRLHVGGQVVWCARQRRSLHDQALFAWVRRATEGEQDVEVAGQQSGDAVVEADQITPRRRSPQLMG